VAYIYLTQVLGTTCGFYNLPYYDKFMHFLSGAIFVIIAYIILKKYIKEKGKWTLVREQYLKIKKQYLTSNDYNHSSFICYIEAVNNVYNSRKHWN